MAACTRSLAVATLMALVASACGGAGVVDETAPATGSDAPTSEVPPDEPATAATPTTAIAIVEDADDAAIAVVVSALDAKNRFDLDAWLAAFEGGERKGVPFFAEEILMNAQQHWEIVEPCEAIGGSPSGDTRVDCLVANSDVFWSVGGIVDTKTQTFTVNGDGQITSTNWFASDRRDAFNRAFHQWLSDTYPDVYEAMGLEFISSSGPGFDAQDSDQMLIAVDYVEEFVAQSDTYPLDPADQ